MIAETYLIAAFIFIFGLLFGSFITLASYRIPRGEPIFIARSQCPKCHHVLGFWDLFPLFSWLLKRGKCRYCHVKISARYPFIELNTGLVFLLIYMRMGLTPESALITALSVCLLILIVTDLEHTIIPDKVQLVMLVLGVAYLLIIYGPTWQLILGPVIGVGTGLVLRYIFTAWKKTEALGLGDVKFLATVGLFLDPQLVVFYIFLSGFIGIVTALLWQMIHQKGQFPFGPALASALFVCLLYPQADEEIKHYILLFVLG